MTYLDLKLQAGESFDFETPKGQTTGFIFPRKGDLTLHDLPVPLRNLSILENNEGSIKLKASTDSQFVLLMAEPQLYPILSQGGSVHTNKEAMERSFARIQKIGMGLSA